MHLHCRRIWFDSVMNCVSDPKSMVAFRSKLFPLIAIWIVIIQASGLTAEQIPVRHIEGVTLGFLVLRNTKGEALAYGEWKQVVKPDGLVVDDLRFQFKDGSLYE